MSCGAVQDAVAAFWAFVIDYYFLAVAHRLHFLIAVRAKQRSLGGLGFFIKSYLTLSRYNFCHKSLVDLIIKKKKDRYGERNAFCVL